MNASDELPRTGDVIAGRYRIESQLGAGGMGAVFAAVNQATGRAVAIKCMLGSATRSKEALARFLVEARATARIEHPNVIQILDVQEERGAPFLVMERLRGESLAERLERTGRLCVPEALSVAIAACRGVAAAHDEGIVHRDLKPDNIFLCEGKDGAPHPPKVLDFGISKLYDDEAGAKTRTGMTMGTPQYMSPEQLSASVPPDARFDVYAMGVVLYECLTGRRPYESEGLFELVQEIATGRPPPIRELAPDVSPALESIVLRAMSNDRELRPPTMHALARELEPIARGAGVEMPAARSVPPTRAAAPSASSKPSSPPPQQQRHGALLAVAALAAALILGVIGVAVIVAVVGLREDESEAPPAPVATPVALPAPVASAPVAPSNPLAPDVELRFGGSCVVSPAGPYVVSGGGGTLTLMWGSTPQTHGMLNLSITTDDHGTVPVTSRLRSPAHATLRAGPQTWTSVAPIGSRAGWTGDRVGGSIVVTQFAADLAVAELTFQGVTLESTNGSTCTIDGRLQTRGATWGP